LAASGGVRQRSHVAVSSTSACTSRGWSVTDIADRLGDSIETVQSVYLHAYDAAKREAENRAKLAALMAAQDGSKAQSNGHGTGTEGR
jgi:hypothetical protein